MDNMKEDHDAQEKHRKTDDEKYSNDQISIKDMKKDFGKMSQGLKSNMHSNMPKFPDINKFKF